MTTFTDIDRPRNALTLALDLHQLFGNFEKCFEPIAQTPYTYRIDSAQSEYMRNPIFPLSRIFHPTTTRTIDPPSPRVLAIRRALTLVLHLSTDREYIDKTIQGMDELDVKEDGIYRIGTSDRTENEQLVEWASPCLLLITVQWL
jgi:HNH endonuclease